MNQSPATILATFRPPRFYNIDPGDIVTFSVPNGIGRHGQEFKLVSGRAVMCFPTHVVVNMGGQYGRPGVVDENNYQSHKAGRSNRKSKGQKT